MKKILLALTVILSTVGWVHVKKNQDACGCPKDKIFNVKNYSSDKSGKTFNSVDLRRAVDAAIKCGGGTVYLPNDCKQTELLRLYK